MRRGRWVTGAIAATAVSLLLAPGALAGKNQEIYKDLSDGVVNGNYTAAEWTAFFKSATAQAYPPGQGGQGQVVAGVAGAQTPERQTRPQAVRSASPLAQTQERGALPFTGLDLALLTVGGALLLGVGATLRKVARERG